MTNEGAARVPLQGHCSAGTAGGTLLMHLERAIEPAVTDQDRARFPPPSD
jgi:hypothetical protein